MNQAQKRFLDDLRLFFQNSYSCLSKTEIILYGAGGLGQSIYLGLEEMGLRKNVVAVCDGNKKRIGENFVENINIVSVQDALNSFPDACVVICSTVHDNKMRQLLEEYNCNSIFEKNKYLGFVETMRMLHDFKCKETDTIDIFPWFGRDVSNIIEKINNADYYIDTLTKDILINRALFFSTGQLEYLLKIPVKDSPYFDNEYYKIGKDEVFVDCGAYNGDSIIEFCSYTDSKYRVIYAFEPDSMNYESLKKNTSYYDNIIYMNAGVGEREQECTFEMTGTSGSRVVYDDNDNISDNLGVINIVLLDKTVNTEVTLIKMDIEGFEMDAIKGAKDLITRYKPKLAISIYHKFDDIVTIAEYLHSLVPDYKMLVRHHTDAQFDTVLYAHV